MTADHFQELTTSGPEETHNVGQRIGELLAPAEVIIICGTLGAGKTILSQGIAAGMGVTDPVTSSTFVLATPYHGSRGELWHLDAYRIKDLTEVDDLGLDELLERGASLMIEWGDRIEAALPYITLRIDLEVRGETQRHIRIVRQQPDRSR